MKPVNVFVKTLPFVFLKIAVGAVEILLSFLALWLLVKLGMKIGGTTGSVLAFVGWMIFCRAGHSFLTHIAGYLIKAGHVAVVAEICSTGQIPQSQISFGFRKVKSRFAASGVFFLVDKLVSGAVSQIQKTVGRIGGFLDFIPGMQQITGILQKFIGIFLNYIDECCLGWIFLHEGEGAFKTACDGIVIYYQNVKHLLKSAAITTVSVVLATAAIGVVSLALTSALGMSGSIYTMIVLLAAIMLTWVMKTSVIDSWVMVKMMCSYMEVAVTTEIKYDLYDKLCGISSSFKKLFRKAQKETTQPAC